MKEDKAYYLFNIFDITIPLIYGKERVKALRKLKNKYNTKNSLLSYIFSLKKYLLITALKNNKSKKYLKC